MEKDIKIIKNWVTFFGVLTIITILVGLHTMYQTYKATRLYEDTPTTHSFSGGGAGGDFIAAPAITIDATDAPDVVAADTMTSN